MSNSIFLCQLHLPNYGRTGPTARVRDGPLRPEVVHRLRRGRRGEHPRAVRHQQPEQGVRPVSHQLRQHPGRLDRVGLPETERETPEVEGHDAGRLGLSYVAPLWTCE